MITNGFTYIAVLMFIAGGLLFLEKNMKCRSSTSFLPWSSSTSST